MKKELLIIIFVMFAFALSGQNMDDNFSVRLFAGFKIDYFTLNGNFDGESYFFTEDAMMFIPDIEPGIAYGLQIGLRFNRASWDIAYQVSSHKYIPIIFN